MRREKKPLNLKSKKAAQKNWMSKHKQPNTHIIIIRHSFVQFILLLFFTSLAIHRFILFVNFSCRLNSDLTYHLEYHTGFGWESGAWKNSARLHMHICYSHKPKSHICISNNSFVWKLSMSTEIEIMTKLNTKREGEKQSPEPQMNLKL